MEEEDIDDDSIRFDSIRSDPMIRCSADCNATERQRFRFVLLIFSAVTHFNFSFRQCRILADGSSLGGTVVVVVVDD